MRHRDNRQRQPSATPPAPWMVAAVGAQPVVRRVACRGIAGRNRSRAGAPTDGARLALAIEGGGMRGVVSAGMTAAIELLGLTACFDLIVGTSAGALNGAGLLAGVADACCNAYHAVFTTRRFINPYRLLIGQAAVDVAFTLDHCDEALDAARHERTAASGDPAAWRRGGRRSGSWACGSTCRPITCAAPRARTLGRRPTSRGIAGSERRSAANPSSSRVIAQPAQPWRRRSARAPDRSSGRVRLGPYAARPCASPSKGRPDIHE